MKLHNILILIAVLFLSDYAIAQIPECPCDDAELSNGLTGNEIIDIVCPGGSLGADSEYFLTRDSIAVTLVNVPHSDYVVRVTNIGNRTCAINSDGPEFVSLSLTDGEYNSCRTRLIEGCSLSLANPIPTLSEWGLISMAGVLVFAGLFAIRRRKAAA